MSGMHLLPPMYNTTGKSRKKSSYRTSEQKQRAERARDEWKELLAKHGAEQEQRKRERALKAKPYTPDSAGRRRNSLDNIPSSRPDTWDTCAKPEQKVYTGTAMKGIGTMHKSNMVPIFSDEEAVAISRMRR